MDIRPIETEDDYDWALAGIERYFDNEPKRGTRAAQRFDVRSVLIRACEDKHRAILRPDPIDAIREVMARQNLRQADLALLVGGRSRASELLGRKRGLTMEQAMRLHQEWNIPAEVLLRPAQTAGAE